MTPMKVFNKALKDDVTPDEVIAELFTGFFTRGVS